eukprot:TRINITY_DN48571_c0_g1_i1.p1 TRINITY_DN48571_c0_g1~~TRINITY_DN48571_c0_g1_i1.p1  ORF type:complete len:676 (+),score=76.49 TRINITY_DN48571_c0_g1_i1:121-2148(+)
MTGSASTALLSLMPVNAAYKPALLRRGFNGRGLSPFHGAKFASLFALLLMLLQRTHTGRRVGVGIFLFSLRSVTPLASLLVLRNTIWLVRHSRVLSFRRIMWQAMSFWAVVEVAFLAYFFQCRRHLEAQTSRRWLAVTTHSTAEKRKASMDRYLKGLVQVCHVGTTDGEPRATNDAMTLSLNDSSCSHPRRHTSVGDLGLNRSRRSWDRPRSSSNFHRADASVDNLLELWENDGGGTKSVSEKESLRLGYLELGAWFTGPGCGDPEDPASWLRKDNVEDWIAHYWFRGATPQELARFQPQESKELRGLVKTALEHFGLSQLPQGRNEKIRPYLLSSDRLPVLHRPLFVYLGCSMMFPLLTGRVMRWLGFTRERVGGLLYWMRPRRSDVPSSLDIAAPGHTPLVFVHGLGVGLVPYYLLIARLSRQHSGEMFVPEFPFLAMAPWESVPSAREIVAQLQDMLKANRHTAAHFMGHSFGSIVIGWMMKMSPSSVVYTTLMEPALFLTLKSDSLTRLLYHPTKHAFETLIRYLTFRELFTVNLLFRNFFWEQSLMWPEDLRVPTVVQLAGDDHIVPSIFVRRLLEHECAARKKKRRLKKPPLAVSSSSGDVRADNLHSKLADRDTLPLEIQWCAGNFHGQILCRRDQTTQLFAAIKRSVQGDGREGAATSTGQAFSLPT